MCQKNFTPQINNQESSELKSYLSPPTVNKLCLSQNKNSNAEYVQQFLKSFAHAAIGGNCKATELGFERAGAWVHRHSIQVQTQKNRNLEKEYKTHEKSQQQEWQRSRNFSLL